MAEPISALRLSDVPYTPYFCEENVWWLARHLAESGLSIDALQVWLITNPDRSVLLYEQRLAVPGYPIAWDYHLVLRIVTPSDDLIVDRDSRLTTPTDTARYLAATFPAQAMLPRRYRANVRLIPARSYLDRFTSDRSHMRAQLPASAFPDYAPIRADAAHSPIDLAAYRDHSAPLDDGSRIMTIDALRIELRSV